MIVSVIATLAYGACVVSAFREIVRDSDQHEGRIFLSVAVMIVAAVACGGILAEAMS